MSVEPLDNKSQTDLCGEICRAIRATLPPGHRFAVLLVTVGPDLKSNATVTGDLGSEIFAAVLRQYIVQLEKHTGPSMGDSRTSSDS